MENDEPVMSFDEAVALEDATYVRGDEEPTIAFLRECASGGPALEFGIGTGRIVLPLAATGIRVDGLDLSPAMIAQLRSKSGGHDLSVTLGDMADAEVPGTYRLIYVIFNSFFNLLSQDDQVRCFQNAASHLTPDGMFVIEGGMTPTFFERLHNGQYLEPQTIEIDHVTLDLLRIDPATQMLDENHVSLGREGVRFVPVVQRYAWPPELDLMARIAGLRLKERWGSWTHKPFSVESTNVISVYGP